MLLFWYLVTDHPCWELYLRYLQLHGELAQRTREKSHQILSYWISKAKVKVWGKEGLKIYMTGRVLILWSSLHEDNINWSDGRSAEEKGVTRCSQDLKGPPRPSWVNTQRLSSLYSSRPHWELVLGSQKGWISDPDQLVCIQLTGLRRLLWWPPCWLAERGPLMDRSCIHLTGLLCWTFGP